MTKRKKKLRLIQISLLLLGIIIVFFTYSKDYRTTQNSELLTQVEKDKIKKELGTEENENSGNQFFNIEYSGFDLSGNRYILKSKEARTEKLRDELIYMTDVEAIFYFKDETILYVNSKYGIYNNKTLDMKFNTNVKADYENSKLTAEQAEYSNSLGFLTISNNVIINDKKGNLIADKLLFDIKNQTVNIDSFNEDKINANITIKWKKVSEY